MNLQTRRGIGSIVLYVVGVILLIAGLMKLLGLPTVSVQFTKWGVIHLLVLTGILELISAVLLLVPRTRIVGSFVVTAYMGAAIMTHLFNLEYALAFMPLLFMLLVWVGLSLEKPQLHLWFDDTFGVKPKP